jgi:hypothetical protein
MKAYLVKSGVFTNYLKKFQLRKESSLIGKTLHCGCKKMGSNPISRWVRSLIGKTIVCGAVNTGSNPVEPLAV